MAEEVPRKVYRFKRDGFGSVVKRGNNLECSIVIVKFMVLSRMQKRFEICVSHKMTREIHRF